MSEMDYLNQVVIRYRHRYGLIPVELCRTKHGQRLDVASLDEITNLAQTYDTLLSQIVKVPVVTVVCNHQGLSLVLGRVTTEYPAELLKAKTFKSFFSGHNASIISWRRHDTHPNVSWSKQFWH